MKNIFDFKVYLEFDANQNKYTIRRRDKIIFVGKRDECDFFAQNQVVGKLVDRTAALV